MLNLKELVNISGIMRIMALALMDYKEYIDIDRYIPMS